MDVCVLWSCFYYLLPKAPFPPPNDLPPLPRLPNEPPWLLFPPNEFGDEERDGDENERAGRLCCGWKVSLGVELRFPNEPLPKEWLPDGLLPNERLAVDRVLLCRGVPNVRLPLRSGLSLYSPCLMLPNVRLSFGRFKRWGALAHVRCPGSCTNPAP